MSPELLEMVDHHQIRKVLAEYCNGCDRCDEQRMAAVYCDDSWDDHGSSSGTGVDFTRSIMDGMRDNNSVSHLLGQSTIVVENATAGAETYFFAVIRNDDGAGGETLHQLGGRYVDRLVREARGWRIKHRTAVRDWSITLPIENDWVGQRGLTPGRRTNADPSFDALGIRHSGTPESSNF